MQVLAKENNNKNDVVLKVIDNVLNQVLGKEATTLIYQHMERQYSLKHDEIGDKIELFAQGLEDFLRSGAYVVEKKILEDINECTELHRIELESIDDEASFVAQLKLLKHHA